MLLTQIKLSQDVGDTNGNTARIRPTLKAAMRLAEKEEQELIGMIEKYHDPAIIQPIVNYDQEKSQLQQCLDIPSEERNKKILKKIKAELTYLRSFQTNTQEENIPKEVQAIMKRDLDMLTAVISKFVHPKLYPKGSVIENVANDRNKVRVLLRGEVAVFEPINYKSFKNCKKFHQNQNTNELIRETISMVTGSKIHFDSQQPSYSSLLQRINPEELQLSDWKDLKKTSRTMSIQTAKSLLQLVNLITMTTPHRLSRHLKKQGQLICSDIHQYIVDQPQIYQHTAICLNECYVMELQYDVYKQSIAHLNSDEQKKYIEVLLRKFENMDYFDAKQYVRNQFMINKRREEEQLRLKQKMNPAPLSELEQAYKDNQGTPLYQADSDSDDQHYERIYKKITRPQEDLETFQLKFENDLYLIIEGEVTLQIDIIEETRLSSLQYASKIRQRHPRPILKLYQGDLFGFQDIGKTKEYNLTYIITKDSKLLLLNQDIYVRHYYQIEGFKNGIKKTQAKRDKLISGILQNIQKTVQKQQLKKYSSIANLEKHRMYDKEAPSKKEITETLLSSHLSPPRQLQFVGKKQFDNEEHKLRQNVVKLQQGTSKGINLRQILEGSDDVNELLAFTSVHKINLPENCQIVGDFIEVRGSKGTLLRRRAISKKSVPSDGSKRKSTLLSRIGVINDKERIEHNFQVVKKRKSKYEIEDFDKEKKEFKRLKSMAHSLPKLGYLYARKEELLYKNMNKLKYDKPYI